MVELDEATVEKIAAGEVVERPASAVKELVENALDAGADRIEVAIERGGKDLLRVRDDGVGMTEAGVRKAVRRHTTSKIRSAEDLSGVGTLGFRGEALATIAAVSRLTIRTRPPDADAGTELRMAGGDVVAVEPAGPPAGTTVEVTDLFYNTPARRRYLKRDRTEFSRVNDVVTNYALANPDVAISLTHDGHEVFATPGRGDLQATLLAVYGREVAENMIEVADPGTGDGSGPVSGVEGYVSHPETTRSSADYLSTFVNGRYVRSSAVREAVLSAYDDQLGPDRYPFAVLFLSVPADAVDVNVHPRKTEVRYSDSGAVRERVRRAVEESLRGDGLLRSSAPRGRSTPEQTTIDPAGSAEVDGALDDAPGDAADESAGGGGDAREPGTGAGDVDEPGGEAGDAREPGGGDPAPGTEGPPDSGSARGTDGRSSQQGPDGSSASSGADAETPESPEADAETPESPEADAEMPESAPDSPASPAPHPRPSSSTTVTGPDVQTTLGGEDAHPPTEYDTLPDLRVLGQLHDTYVVAETDDGLLLIDQHAADERINYERLRGRFEGDTTTQALADPIELELTAGEAAVFDGYEDVLARMGFRADRVDDRTVEVTTVPAVLADAAGPELLRDVLADLAGERAPEETVEAAADDMLADVACHPSVTGNTSLTEGSVVGLLSELDDCENPWACPHGRPVLIHIDSDEIQDRFERDYPGH
ncbi:MAG: DNA mismatch repair endonuclease MutL [Halobacteriales archaeon]